MPKDDKEKSPSAGAGILVHKKIRRRGKNKGKATKPPEPIVPDTDSKPPTPVQEPQGPELSRPLVGIVVPRAASRNRERPTVEFAPPKNLLNFTPNTNPAQDRPGPRATAAAAARPSLAQEAELVRTSRSSSSNIGLEPADDFFDDDHDDEHDGEFEEEYDEAFHMLDPFADSHLGQGNASIPPPGAIIHPDDELDDEEDRQMGLSFGAALLESQSGAQTHSSSHENEPGIELEHDDDEDFDFADDEQLNAYDPLDLGYDDHDEHDGFDFDDDDEHWQEEEDMDPELAGQLDSMVSGIQAIPEDLLGTGYKCSSQQYLILQITSGTSTLEFSWASRP